jgi:hypothetical protein
MLNLLWYLLTPVHVEVYQRLRTPISPMAAQPTVELAGEASMQWRAPPHRFSAKPCSEGLVHLRRSLRQSLTERDHRRCAYSESCTVRRPSSRHQALCFDPVVILAEPKGGVDIIASYYDCNFTETTPVERECETSLSDRARVGQ